MRQAFLLLLLLPFLVAGQVRITYLANEGVLLTAGTSKVLIDALFRDSLGDYARHDATTQEQLETGKPPYDRVVLALATHYHLDHWDAGSISRFLGSNPAAWFSSTPTATGMIPRSLKTRVRSVWPAASEQFEIAGVRVEAFPLHHGETQNLAYAISIGGRTVMHVGDAEAIPANFANLLARPAPDVALIPFWWLIEDGNREFVLKKWNPRHVVAIHFGAADIRAHLGPLRKAAPGVWLATESGEARSY